VGPSIQNTVDVFVYLSPREIFETSETLVRYFGNSGGSGTGIGWNGWFELLTRTGGMVERERRGGGGC
jgi:hypothetical protein